MPEFSKHENEPQEQEETNIHVERITGADEQTLEQLAEIERLCFSEEMAEDKDELREIIQNPEGIHLKLEDKDGKIIGYISSLRQNQEFDSLKEYDADLKPNDSLYIHSFDIRPENRNLKNFNALFNSLKTEATRNGYEKLSMYARTTNRLSSVLQKRHGAKFFRRIENWRDLGEALDYLEIPLNQQEKK